MKIAFVVFEGLTALDFVGAYDALTRLKTMNFRSDIEWDVCAFKEKVSDGRGLVLIPTMIGSSLAGYDLLVVPGGYAAVELSKDREFLAWLGTFRFSDAIAASVCSGALLLAALGVLKGLAATTHRGCFELLRPQCREVVEARVVDEGRIITARGVTSSIDLGLHLCERLAGVEVAAQIAAQMDYERPN